MLFAVEGAIAVLGVAEDGMPDVRKVGADLMRLARVQGDFEKAQPLLFFEDAVFGDDGLPTRYSVTMGSPRGRSKMRTREEAASF